MRPVPAILVRPLPIPLNKEYFTGQADAGNCSLDNRSCVVLIIYIPVEMRCSNNHTPVVVPVLRHLPHYLDKELWDR